MEAGHGLLALREVEERAGDRALDVFPMGDDDRAVARLEAGRCVSDGRALARVPGESEGATNDAASLHEALEF